MGKNTGRFISRETDTYWNGDRAITDTFMLDDGTLVFHLYNVTADGREHSHQIMDQNGRHIYARAIGGEHPWIEIDRMNAVRWLSTLSNDKLSMALNLMNKQELQFISEMLCATEQVRVESIEPAKKLCVDKEKK